MSSKSAPLSYDPSPIPERVQIGAPGVSLNPEAVYKTLQAKFSSDIVAFHNKHNGDPWIEVKGDALAKVAQHLRDDQDLQFIALQVVSGTDFLPRAAQPAEEGKEAVPAMPGRLEVVYVLYSYAFRTQLTLKVVCDRDHAKAASLCHVYRSANWYEREIYDLMGVTFEGHVHHKRILLPPDWVGHPLRKDYIFPEEYNGMKVPL